jgi:membrane fusion protein, multidrug efflux system
MSIPKIFMSRVSLAGLMLVLLCAAFAAGAYRDHLTSPAHASAGSAKSSKVAKSAKPPVNSASSDRVPVRVFEVGRSDASHQRRALTGIVRARYESSIGFRVNGKIAHRWAEVGETVKQGQLLFELDDADYQLQLKTAEANLQIANANVIQTIADEKRQRQLLASNAISPSEHERSIAARDAALGQQISAQKQRELAANQIEHCRLKAEFSGVILAITAETGQVVAIGDQVCTLAKTDELEAVVDIPENRLPREPLVNAAVEFWSLPGVRVNAKLREVSPIADPLTRTYQGRFTLLDPGATVKLGMTSTVIWNDSCEAQSNLSDTFAIPPTSIYQSQGLPSVWLVNRDSGELTSLPVEIERYTSDKAIVRGNLAPGQLLVSAGAHKLDKGQRVRIWERQP